MLTDAELLLAHEYGSFVEFADRMGLQGTARAEAERIDREHETSARKESNG